MRKSYDFSKARRNPYSKLFKQRVTIRLEGSTVSYFKALAAETGIPYQTLMNLYQRDCAIRRRRLPHNP
jgi:predicted DNA binding CopG/RHH family protein